MRAGCLHRNWVTFLYFDQDRLGSYHSLQASLTKRFSRGFTLLANYTFSKSLDNFADEVVPWNIPGAERMVYGPSDFDHRHRFVISWVWELPNLRTGNPFLRSFLNGWQATGIGQYQTGSPLTITSGRDNWLRGLSNDRAKLTGISRDKPAGADKRLRFNPAAFTVNDVGTFGEVGTGAFYGPRLFGWDMGFFKNNGLTEQTNIQFRAEFFNIFNQVNFDNPNTRVTGGGFGTITRTHPNAGDPRIIQFGLKLVF
jgi:hypothetical protein